VNKQVPKEFWIVTLVYATVLMVLAIPVALGKLSPRAFAVLVVVSMIFPFLRYWRLFQAAAKDRSQLETAHALPASDETRSRIRSAKIRIAALSAFTCFAIWETRSGPLAPRLVGLGFLLLLLLGNILVLRQARKMLEQLNSGE